MSIKINKIAPVLAFALGALPLAPHAMEVLGAKPHGVPGEPSSVPNQQAISRMIWAPGIDDGYVPQGVTWAGGALYLSAYRSTDPKVDRGPCRIFKLDPESGKAQGQFDLPADCGHAGGLAHAADNVLIAADTRRLYRIDASLAFSPEHASKAVTATVGLRGAVKGSFAAFDGSALFLGSYEKDEAKARGHFFLLSIFDTHDGKAIDETAALRTIPLPREAQGAAFDKSGRLWITSSSGRFGMLTRLDADSGRPASRYEMVIGIEDLGFDAEGGLWTVSEAGSLRWQKWGKTFPIVFRIDLGKLNESR